MRQLDKLKTLVEQLIETSREMRFKSARLEKENKRLKLQLEQIRNQKPEVKDDAFLANLLNENERLKVKNQTARSQLGAIVTELERHIELKNIGVDS